MRKPLVSIVLPVYNGERYLSRSVESCLSQSYPNLELIIVNDASTDRTIDLITSFADPRIRVVQNQQNQGLPRSLNIGFAQASGEFLTWTSADNYYATDAIESLAGALAKAQNEGLVYGSFHLVDESDQIIGKKHCPPPVYLPRENTVGAYFLYRREVRDAVGDYDPDLRLAEDYDYWLRIYRRFPVMLVDSDSYYYRVHDESLTGTSREAEVLSAARLAQLKSVTPISRLKCTAYCTLNPLAAGLSRSRVGLSLRAPLSGLWRKIGGR